MHLLFFRATVARIKAESTQRAGLFTLIAAMLCSLFLFHYQPITSVHADVSCNPSSGGTCSYATNQNNNHYDCHTSTDNNGDPNSSLYNSFVQGCLESYVIAGTGDSMRYFYFDMVTTTDPDEANGVWLNETSGNGDSSQSGTDSTLQARVWSNARTNGICKDGICNQQSKQSMQPNDLCSPNGGTQAVSGTYTAGGLNVGYTMTEPIYSGCTNRASVPDVYSAYTNYTRMDASSESEVTVDAVSGQWAPNNYNNRTGQIGWSYMGEFWQCLNCKEQIQSPRYYEWYHY